MKESCYTKEISVLILDSWFLEEKASFMAPYSMVLFLNKDTNVAYAIEKNEFDEPGHVK